MSMEKEVQSDRSNSAVGGLKCPSPTVHSRSRTKNDRRRSGRPAPHDGDVRAIRPEYGLLLELGILEALQRDKEPTIAKLRFMSS